METRWFYDIDPLFSEFSRLRDELDRIYDIGLPLSDIRSVPRGTFPAVNLNEDAHKVTVAVFLPGIDPKKVEVTFQDNALTIKGERDTTQGSANETSSGNYHRRERFSGSFSRILSLPEGLDPDKINASYKDGILNIAIEKREEQKPKQISIKVE